MVDAVVDVDRLGRVDACEICQPEVGALHRHADLSLKEMWREVWKTVSTDSSSICHVNSAGTRGASRRSLTLTTIRAKR